MTLRARLRVYAAHRDPATAACNRIALLVASGQPTYPLYIAWLVGGTWQVACVTFLSTPFFLAVPALARRNALAGRALLVLAGVGNGLLATKALGEASGVALFLAPTMLIAGLAFRGGARLGLIALNLGAIMLYRHFGPPWGAFGPQAYPALWRLNAWSAGALLLIIAFMLAPRPGWRR